MITPELIAQIRAALRKATQERWEPKQIILNHVGKPAYRSLDRDTSDEDLCCLLRNHAGSICDEMERLLDAEKKFNTYRDKGLEIFASPCEKHSGINAPPFDEYVERYGRKCTICMVDEIERLRARVTELEVEHASDKQARYPRDFDAVPRDYAGNADDMIAELEAEVESSRRADVAINQALNEGDGSYRP